MKYEIVNEKDVQIKVNFLQKKSLTIENVANLLLDIMSKHIGTDDEISRGRLFKKIFKKDESPDLADWVRWEFVKKATHHCRRYTKCFIASRRIGGVWFYFVVKSRSDAQEYCMVLDKSIRSMRSMQKKALQAAEKQWYKEDWFLPNSEQRRIK